MLTAINGYFDGSYIVLNEKVALKKGQKVIITADLSEKPAQKNVDLSRFMGRGEKMFDDDAGRFVEDLRD